MGLSCTVSEINGDFGRKSQIFPTPAEGVPFGIGYCRGQNGATRPRKKFDDIFCRVDTIHQHDRRTARCRGGAGNFWLGGSKVRGSGGQKSPSGVQGQSPWWGVRGGGEAPLKLKAFYLSEVVRKPQNASFGVFWKLTKIHVSTMSW